MFVSARQQLRPGCSRTCGPSSRATAHARAVAAAALLACCAGPWTVDAQEAPYSNFLIGDRALGFGGAFVALADDASATFHNPGGIGSLPTSSVSGGLWAVSFESSQVDRGYATPLGAGALEYSADPSLPLFVAGVAKVGQPDADGIRPHGLGAALLTPRRRDLVSTLQLDAGAESAVDRLEVRHEDRARWYGLSYAYRASDQLSLGASVFFARRSLEHSEVEINVAEGQLTDLASAHAGIRDSALEASQHHLVLRLGGLARFDGGLRAGAMLQIPGIDLGGSAELNHLASSFEDDRSVVDARQAEALVPHLPLPWELRVGVGYGNGNGRGVRLSLDLSLIGPAGDSEDPQGLVELGPGDPPPGYFVPARYHRRAVLRGALGIEAEPLAIMPLRGGIFIEPSAFPRLPVTSTTYRPERVHTYGASLSLGLRTQGWDFSLGATVALGIGEGLGLMRDDDGEASYGRTKVSTRTIFVYLGGGKRFVRRLVKTITR